jgi:hypothetical protein
MKSIKYFLVVTLVCSSTFAQYGLDNDKYFYPEMVIRNGYQQHQLKVPEAKNLLGVWKRIGTASFIMGDPHSSNDAFFADTIVFVRGGTEPDKISAVFIRGEKRSVILDVEFEDHKEPYEYEHEVHYSMRGIGKTQDGWDEVDFFEKDYPRVNDYSMAAIKRFVSIGDKYLVLQHETEDEEWQLRSQIYEGFIRAEVGMVMPSINAEAYNRRYDR